MSVAVRQAGWGDLDACARIIAAEGDGDLDSWRERFTEVLEDRQRLFMVAGLAGEVVGFGQARKVEETPGRGPGAPPPGWYLSGVTVAASHRRQGIGRLLTAERIERLRRLTDRVYYVTEPGNEPSLELHRRLGFTYVGEVELPGRDEPMLLHRLDLTRCR